MDYLVRGVIKDGHISFYIATTKEICNTAYRFHNTTPTASAALGRLLTAGAIMGKMLKDNAKLTIRINGDGPIGTLLVDANAKGEVRGFAANPNVDLPLKEDGKLDVGGAVGRNGYLSVIKDLGMKDYFSSQSSLKTGEIGDDLSYYFLVSEQIPSVVGLGVLVDVDYSIKASGGYIIQLMPSHTEEDIALLENIANKYGSVTSLLLRHTPEEIAAMMFGEDLLLTKEEIKYHCPCSKGRFIEAISTIAKGEIEAMIEEDHGCTVTCQFCNKDYHLTEDDLRTSLMLKEQRATG